MNFAAWNACGFSNLPSSTTWYRSDDIYKMQSNIAQENQKLPHWKQKKNKNKLFTLNKTPVIRLLIATCTAWRDTYCEEEKNVLVPALNTAKKNSLPRQREAESKEQEEGMKRWGQKKKPQRGEKKNII